MNDPNHVKSIFLTAAEMPPDQRAAYLAEAAGSDDALRARVEALLAAHENPDSFLQEPVARFGATVDFSPPEPLLTERPGTLIGPYKLLEQIGEGGFGVVYMADQQAPVRRRVALKIIKAGMDTRQVIARFEAERQALAMMQHSNIARVLDAGATDTGRPYFVMELVRGIPITEYCDQSNLRIRARLELFIEVCHAVQHAHQKGIIHRDLKPSNVLVTLDGGRAVPKVIDFGVAKAMNQQLTEKTLFTAFAQMVGTPLYMSPEQAEMTSLDIDTRSDIYSLGVLLYELLTGTTPFDQERLRTAAYDEIRRIIREEEPPKPSTRLSSSEALPSIAANRSLEPLKLNRLVQGELDWIVMKCLDKDRNRRYDTANTLAQDVERYLNDEPVEACPPSAAYRLRKFVRRNKGPMLAASLVALALVGGIAGTTLGLIEAARQRDAAQASAEVEKQAKETAEAREAETRAVLEFVESKVFAAARPEGQAGGLGRDVTLRRALEAALPFVDQSFPVQPLIEARLRLTLSTSFGNLGDVKIAADQAERARTIYSKHLGADHPDTLSSMINVANSYAALGRHADALNLREETLALMKAKLGPDHPKTLSAMNNLALSYAALGQQGEALKLHEETLALRKAILGPNHPQTLGSMNNLALTYSALGRHAEALKLGQETLALIKAQLGPDHPATLGSMDSLALFYDAGGQHGEAVQLYEETLTLMKAKLGPDHPTTLMSMHCLAGGYAALGRHGEAVQLYEETLALREAKFGPDHPDTLSSMNILAGLLATSSDPKVGNARRAVELAKRAVELAPKEGNYWNTLGVAQYRAGEWKAAVETLEKSMELQNDGNSRDFFFLAIAHWQLGHQDEARKWYKQAVEWMEKNNPHNVELNRFRAEAEELLAGKPTADANTESRD